MLLIYTAAIFTSALMLFLLQPMFARMVLPLLGGAPAVWNTALVFYQATLLAGYLYAHASTKWLNVKAQILVHMGLLLLALLFLPIQVPIGWKPPTDANPLPWLLSLLAIAVGLPFFVVSTTSPLLQRWFADTSHRYSADPYFLYAASNLGSMLALLSYPALVEPAYGLREQSMLWAIGFFIILALLSLCAACLWWARLLRALKGPPGSDPGSGVSSEVQMGSDSTQFGAARTQLEKPEVTLRRRLRWVLLSFVPSSLMMSVTTYVTTDIASVPLLWVIPLAIYLLSFILVFARRPLLRHGLMVRAMPLFLIPLVIALAIRGTDPMALVIPLHLIALFLISMACHGELALDRPAVSHLTEFYLYLSLGGVLGGSFNALVAPLVFNSVAEYPIVLVLACLLLPWRVADPWNSRARLLDLLLPLILGSVTAFLVVRVQALQLDSVPVAIALMFGIPAIVSFSFSRRPLRFALAIAGIFWASTCFIGSQGRVLYAERSFFGVARVTVDEGGRYHQFMHGSTLHGRQNLDPALRREPVAYYYRTGPLGQFFEALDNTDTLRNVGVVGLGAGGITAYARPGQKWTYYEIDPVVERIARDDRFFTYLQDCPTELHVVLGDGRLSLEASPDGAFDLLILDAYSSDSTPVHLLTRQALQLYLRKTAVTGALVFHISNRYLELEPVLGNLAKEMDLFALAQSDTIISPAEAAKGKTASSFVIMSRAKENLASLPSNSRWRPIWAEPVLRTWTDGYSSILRIMKWRR